MSSVTTSPILPRYDQHFSLSYSYPANALSAGDYQLQTNASPASTVTTITDEYISTVNLLNNFITYSLSASSNPVQSLATNPLNPDQMYISLRNFRLVFYDSSANVTGTVLDIAQMNNIDNCAIAADASYIYLAHSTGASNFGTTNGCVYRYRLSDASFMSVPIVNLGVATGVVDSNKTIVSMFLAGTTLYIGGLNTVIYAADLTNPNPVTNTVQVFQGANTTNTLFAMDSTYLYYSTRETNLIYRTPLNNLNLANTTTFVTLPLNPISLSISGAQLFVADNTQILKISTIDGTYSVVDTVAYVTNAVMNSSGRLFSITANLSPLANGFFSYKMNTSIQFTDVFYPYYSNAFVFNLCNITKNNVLDTFTVNITCFLEGTKILCLVGNTEQYIRIEHLKKGDRVKTLNSGYLPLETMGKSRIYHNPRNGVDGLAAKSLKQDALYIYRKGDSNPNLVEDLCVTGIHSALVEEISVEEREAILLTLEDVYLTEGLYRLPACADKRAEIYDQEGYFNVFHIALSNTDYYANYGVYANGLLMESTSLRHLKELAQMELLF